MKLKRIIEDCKKNRVPMGQIRSGEINDLVNEKTPHTITSWGNEMAYVIPEHLVRELLRNEKD